jgi:transposase-like protein
LHRCLRRHDIGRLPEVGGEKATKKKFKAYPIGFFHIDIAEVQTAEGRLHLFVAIDRTSKFAYVELHPKATAAVSGAFLRNLIAAVPYRIHTVLTDRAIGSPSVRETMARGIPFTTPGAGGSAVPLIREATAAGELFRAHAFEYACARADIEHRTTKPKHPSTNGQVERMNRTIKEATVKRFHYEDHAQRRRHLADVISAYNFGRRLKTLASHGPRTNGEPWLGPHALRVHLQMLDFRARKIHPRPDPSNAGTEQLALSVLASPMPTQSRHTGRSGDVPRSAGVPRTGRPGRDRG